MPRASAIWPRMRASNRSTIRPRSASPSIARKASRRDRRARLARPMRDRLIEKRQRIAHRTFRRARDEAQRLSLDRDGLLGTDRSEIIG